MAAPTLGRIVLYREGRGIPERPAIVISEATDETDKQEERVGLSVAIGDGWVSRQRVPKDESPDEPKPGTWRWPPRVPA